MMTSYIDPVKLRDNLSVLTSDELRERVAGGQLTPEAHAMALKILTERNKAENLPLQPSINVQSVAVADRSAQRRLIDRLLVAYMLLLVACVTVVLADPPWVLPQGGGWQGTFGYLAGLLAGLPWTILAAKTIMTGSAASFWMCAILAVLANIVGLLVLRSRAS